MVLTIMLGCIWGTISVFAKTIENTKKYNGIDLHCISECERTKGVAKTYGATKPYGNYAAVVIYGQNNVSQGTIYNTKYTSSSSAEAANMAIAKRSGSNLKKAVTYHAVVNGDGSFTDSFLEQLVYTVER